MHTPFLLCGYAAALLLMLVGFRGVRRSTPNLRGIRPLAWFILCDLFGILLLASRPWTPAIICMILPNILLVTGGLFLYSAAAAVLGIPPRHFRWLLALCLAVLPVFLWFTYIHNSDAAHLTIHCALIGIIMGVTAVMLFGHRDADGANPANACAWLLTAQTALQTAWASFVLFARPQLTYGRPDPIDVGFSYLSMVIALGTVVALVWLALALNRQDLHRMAQTDGLTGLLNRRAFEEILRREMLRCGRGSSLLGIMLIDLDYFKQINDSLGHMAGDDVLRRIAAVLRQNTRPSDVLARYGGEEFVILLRNSGPDEAKAAAERIRRHIAELSGLPGSVTLTASIGVAVSQPQETPIDFLLRCDEALYCSKRAGRNLVSIDQSAQPVPAEAD